MNFVELVLIRGTHNDSIVSISDRLNTYHPSFS